MALCQITTQYAEHYVEAGSMCEAIILWERYLITYKMNEEAETVTLLSSDDVIRESSLTKGEGETSAT